MGWDPRRDSPVDKLNDKLNRPIPQRAWQGIFQGQNLLYLCFRVKPESYNSIPQIELESTENHIQLF